MDRDLVFKHDLLGPHEDAIRLVAIDPCFHSTDQIVCTLQQSRLSTDNGYTALSYMWGDTTDGHHEIVLNDKPFFVRSNLYSFLRHARDALPERRLWIDALCIDQQQVQERNHQVKIMGQIYATASRVVAWLGIDDSELQYLFQITEARENSRKLHRRYPQTVHYTADLRKAKYEYNGLPPELYHLRWIPPIVIPFLLSPYWQRTWIVQEMLLAKCLSFMCGGKMVECDTVMEIFAQPGRYSGPASEEQFAVKKLLRWYETTTLLTGQLPWSLRLLLYRANPLSASRELSFYELLDDMRDSICMDPRDHVFALLSIVDRGRGFPIDYQHSSATLALQALQHFGGDLRTLSHLKSILKTNNDEIYAAACYHAARALSEDVAKAIVAPVVIFEVCNPTLAQEPTSDPSVLGRHSWFKSRADEDHDILTLDLNYLMHSKLRLKLPREALQTQPVKGPLRLSRENIVFETWLDNTWQDHRKYNGIVACWRLQPGLARYAMTIDTLIAIFLGGETPYKPTPPAWIDFKLADSVSLGRFFKPTISSIESRTPIHQNDDRTITKFVGNIFSGFLPRKYRNIITGAADEPPYDSDGLWEVQHL